MTRSVRTFVTLTKNAKGLLPPHDRGLQLMAASLDPELYRYPR